MEFFLILGLLIVAFLVGEHSGRESPTRTKQVQDIATKESELKNLKTNLHATTTSPWLQVTLLLFLLFVVLGALGAWRDDGGRRYYHRHSDIVYARPERVS